MKLFRLYCLIIALIFNINAIAEDIKWFAQDYKPYAYEKNGVATGLAVDVAIVMMQGMGLNTSAKDIDVRMLSKFFIKMNDDKNTVFFPLVENEKRKDYFKFVGPIATARPVLIAPKSKSITIKEPKDIESYKISTMDGYFAMQELVNNGLNSSIFSTNSNDQDNVQAMISGNVDMVLCDELSCLRVLEDLDAKKDYQVVYSLPTKNLSFAFTKDTNDDLVNKAQLALDSLKDKDVYKQIIKKYKIKW